jgi:hypothetical protein
MLPVRSRPRQQSHLLPGARSLTPWLNKKRFRELVAIQPDLARSFVPEPKQHDHHSSRSASRLYAKTKEVSVIVTKFG